MSYIASFVYCDQIQNNMTPQGLTRNIVTPLIDLQPINIPGNYTFSIACTFADVNVRDNNAFEVFFQNPKGDTISKVNVIIPAKMLLNQQNEDKGIDSLNLDVDLRNVVLNTEGMFSTVIFHNGSKAGEYPINVRRAGK